MEGVVVIVVLLLFTNVVSMVAIAAILYNEYKTLKQLVEQDNKS